MIPTIAIKVHLQATSYVSERQQNCLPIGLIWELHLPTNKNWYFSKCQVSNWYSKPGVSLTSLTRDAKLSWKMPSGPDLVWTDRSAVAVKSHQKSLLFFLITFNDSNRISLPRGPLKLTKFKLVHLRIRF